MPETTDGAIDFGALLNAHEQRLHAEYEVGQKIQGVITAIDRSTVFVDIGSKSEGILDRPELQDENGQLKVKVGDPIEAYCISVEDEGVRLTTKMTGKVMDASLWEAFQSGIPVEGKVLSERKGGYEVQVANVHGFCPFSQMDIFRREGQNYIGEKFLFLISQYDESGRNLVVSRRRLLERERLKQVEEMKQTLKPGDILDGTVQRLMPFGAFVDIGHGFEGLVPVRELSWSRTDKPEDLLRIGEKVKVMVRELNWEGERITLSLREAQGDPWKTLEGRIVVGTRVSGRVTRLQPFGAFVEIEPGIEGLVHISKLGGGRRLRHPEEVVKEGETLEVTIENIDVERRRISLSIVDNTPKIEAVAEPTPGEKQELAPGQEITGTVDSIRDFGVFVNLPDSKRGLLHVSQVELKGSTNRLRALHDMFPPGSDVKVVIREMSGDRVSLTLRSTLEKEAEATDISQFQDSAGKDLGSLGDAFSKLKL